MLRKIVPWMFPLIVAMVMLAVLGWLWRQRQVTRSIPTQVDPEFIRPLEDVQTAEEELTFDTKNFSDDFQDPFLSDVPCFVYMTNTCMPWMSYDNDPNTPKLIVYGAKADAYSLNRWSYLFGRQFLPDFPLFAYYLQENSNDIDAYNDYRNYVSHVNSKATSTKISPVFLFAYINYLLQLDPADQAYQREVVSKSLLFLRYFQVQQEVLRSVTFANDGISQIGKAFIAVTSAVYGEPVARQAFAEGGVLERYYLQEFSSPLTSQSGIAVQREGSIASPRALYQTAQQSTGTFVSLCVDGQALACELSPDSVVCARISWLDSLCGINIYQAPGR